MAVLCWCIGSIAQAQPTGTPSAPSIVRITLERDCFGCATGSRLVLHRDGSATHTRTGKARHGTTDRLSKGQVSADDFAQLARLAVAQRVFDLDDLYDSPDIQDGTWVTIAIESSSRSKQIFRRDGTGPAALTALQAAIEAVQARAAFSP